MLIEFLLLMFYVQSNALDLTGSDFKPRNFVNCFENLGCIETSDEWYDEEYRPVNLQPLDKHVIRTEFILIKTTPNSTELLYDLITVKKETIQIAGYRAGGSVIFLIHDFTSNGYTGWVKHMALVLLTFKHSCNVVSIDWESGAEPPYDQAIANARVVALEAIALIMSLKKNFNLAEDKIHLIGHGVGAHIAGYIGKNITKIGRITALDPNGPRFDHMPPRVRLNERDAQFIEVLHTDAYGSTSQGTKVKMGHADFYFNNADLQPNCKETETKTLTEVDRDYVKAGKILSGCSHKRAFKYFIESLDNPNCKFLGVKCNNYNAFLEGKCRSCEAANVTTPCAEINLKETQINLNGTFYVNTRGDPPFCMQAYIVSFKISVTTKAKEGTFEMIMVSDGNQVANVSTIDANLRTLTPGKTTSYLFYSSPPQLIRVKEVKLKWVHVNSIDCFAFCDSSISIDRIKITPLTLRKNESTTSTLCPVKDKMKIQSDSYVTFIQCGTNSSYLTGRNTPIFAEITPFDYHIATEIVKERATTTTTTSSSTTTTTNVN